MSAKNIVFTPPSPPRLGTMQKQRILVSHPLRHSTSPLGALATPPLIIQNKNNNKHHSKTQQKQQNKQNTQNNSNSESSLMRLFLLASATVVAAAGSARGGARGGEGESWRNETLDLDNVAELEEALVELEEERRASLDRGS